MIGFLMEGNAVELVFLLTAEERLRRIYSCT